jgi:hypothetical protein
LLFFTGTNFLLRYPFKAEAKIYAMGLPVLSDGCYWPFGFSPVLVESKKTAIA